MLEKVQRRATKLVAGLKDKPYEKRLLELNLSTLEQRREKRDIMEVEEEKEVDLVARSYQSQLEEIAINKNTIIHLPTGSGKTFIAIRLINRLSHALKKPWGAGGKRTFFLVNNIPLVNQQKKVIKHLSTAKNVAGYSGEDGVDYWDKKKWDSELADHEVIVMTCQILADMLTHSYIRIEDMNLMIFDECHHAVEDHPMRLIMKHFEGCPVEKQPKVLGLTATLLNCNVSLLKVEETLRELETTFHATIATANEMGEVRTYSTNPNEFQRYFGSSEPTPAARRAMDLLTKLQGFVMTIDLPSMRGDVNIKLETWQRDISTDPKKIVKEVKNMAASMITLIDELGVYGGALSVLAYMVLLERLKRKAFSSEEEFLYKFAITKLCTVRLLLLEELRDSKGFDKIIKHSSDKVVQFLNILKEYNPENLNRPGVTFKVNLSKQPLCGIIFTKQRFTAKVLYNLLKDVKEANPAEFGFLEHDFVVGFNINPFKSTREQHYQKKTSQTALLKFSNKELNCLIATSVIEEGVDIPQCLLVLRYDPPLEYRSYIQSKGRARRAESTYVVMVNYKEKNKFDKIYQSFQETEDYIQKILVGSTDSRGGPSQEDIEENLYNEDQIPPYITPQGARLSAVQAISLLNRYCSVLPHDQFTVITPMWVEEKVHHPKRGALRQVKIYMPIACPVKDIIVGEPMGHLKAAKRSAALTACKRLHEVEELDPVTLLPRHFGTVDFEQPDVKCCFPNWPWDARETDTPKPGTKKRVRKHAKIFPSLLDGNRNVTGQKFYLHVIKLKPCFPEPSDTRDRALYRFLEDGRGYGLLTQQPLPTLCDFPVFLTVGEATASLAMNYAVVQLDHKLFDLVLKFHHYLFEQVLGVLKRFTAFDGSRNCLYAVPVTSAPGAEDYDIDWRTMQLHRHVPPPEEPAARERKSLKVTEEKYLHQVVSPWYRGALLPDRYVVTRVLEHMSPQSCLASAGDELGTFADYYSERYNLQILGDKHQPLLEVRNISSRMNCLMPRAATIKSFTDKQKKLIALAQGEEKAKVFPEIFVPEFCVLYDYPGVLWYKAIMLPSIIHRVTMLLVAYELRAEIAAVTKIGQINLPKGEKWLPIEINIAVTAKALLSLVEDPTPVNTIDRINKPLDDSSSRRINSVSMRESIYQLQRKKICEEYGWDEKLEPIDIERNLSTVTLMDVECYDEFVSAAMPGAGGASPHAGGASPHAAASLAPSTSAAILPSPVMPVSEIKILSTKPTQRGPELRDILTAITTINSHDNFDLERVETLGDSFLKYASSIFLYHRFPTLNEGQLTNIKCQLIGNANLFYAGQKVRLGGRMKVEQFSPRKDFLVPGFFTPMEVQRLLEKKQVRPTCLIGIQFTAEEILSGELSEQSWDAIYEKLAPENEESLEHEPASGAQPAMQSYVRAQAVADKHIADCVESLIGTYLLNEGIQGAVKVLEWLQVFSPKYNLAASLAKKPSTALSEGKTTAEEIDRVMNHSREDVETILGYKFKDPTFLLEALSHPTHIRNRLTRSYERLEFIGDAILDFLITSHVFESCPDLKPGDLTDLRSALVNNVTFASYVVRLGLHKFLCYQLNPVLESAIMMFIEHQEQRGHTIVEDVLYLIDEEDCHIAEYVEVPKVLSDLFESLAGAIYLDTGGDLQAVWRVYYRIMSKEIHEFSRRIPIQPVRMLHEDIHACPVFGSARVVDENVGKVMVAVTVTKNGRQHTVHGFGANKFQAKRAAAKLALKVLAI